MVLLAPQLFLVLVLLLYVVQELSLVVLWCLEAVLQLFWLLLLPLVQLSPLVLPLPLVQVPLFSEVPALSQRCLKNM